MGQARINRRLGLTNPRTPAGFVSLLIDNKGAAFRFEAEDKHRAHTIAQNTAQIMFEQHGQEAIRDMGHATACELVTSMQLLMKCGDHEEAKKARLKKEAAQFAFSLAQFEQHPYIRVTHNSEAMTTEIRKLKEDEILKPVEMH